MKKCNFFSVLVTALFMFVSVYGQAQNYFPVQSAKEIVLDARNDISNQISVLPANKTAEYNDGVAKIRLADSMLELLNSGESVSSAFDKVISFAKFPASMERLGDEAKLYFERILTKN